MSHIRSGEEIKHTDAAIHAGSHQPPSLPGKGLQDE